MNINLLNDEELSALRQLIDGAEHIVICSHKSPDGDAVGSSLGWADYLRLLGKEPVICVPDMYPDFLQWLPGAQQIVRHDKHPETVSDLFAKADLLFCLDFSQYARTERMVDCFQLTHAKIAVVDHHPNPDIKTDFMVSRPQMSSTSELVFRLIWQLGGFEAMTKKAAVPIYCGMMTDTGGFTYNSSNPEIFFIISQLLTKGFDKDRVYRNVYNNFSEQRLRLTGFMLYKKLRVYRDKHASYFCLTRSDLKRFNYIKGDAEGMVNMPLQMKGMKLSISLREDTEQDHLIWVSLRSVDNFNCTTFAQRWFNGGGHFNASGGRLYCSVEEAEKIVQEAIDSI